MFFCCTLIFLPINFIFRFFCFYLLFSLLVSPSIYINSCYFYFFLPYLTYRF
jgi:hypothetical protein